MLSGERVRQAWHVLIGKAHVTDLPPPPGWGADPLTSFMADAARNRWATFAHYGPTMRNLAYLDAQFMGLDGWRDPPNPVTPHLAFRSHSNFRAACEHALAGQLGDMFPMIRACIEAAAYAVHLEGDAKRTEAWLRRHDGAAAMKVARGRDFHHTTVLASVMALDARVGALFGELYQQSIDYGGHPNERGLSANAQAMPDEGGRHLSRSICIRTALGSCSGCMRCLRQALQRLPFFGSCSRSGLVRMTKATAHFGRPCERSADPPMKANGQIRKQHHRAKTQAEHQRDAGPPPRSRRDCQAVLKAGRPHPSNWLPKVRVPTVCERLLLALTRCPLNWLPSLRDSPLSRRVKSRC